MESIEDRLYTTNTRIPTIQEIEQNKQKNKMKSLDLKKFCKKSNYVIYDNFYREEIKRNIKRENGVYSYCLISVLISFILGLSIGVILVQTNNKPIENKHKNNTQEILIRTLNSVNHNSLKTDEKTDKIDETSFSAVSFIGEHKKYVKESYPKILTEDMTDILKDYKEVNHVHRLEANKTFVANDLTVLFDNIYWGPEIENAMPQGYGEDTAEIWESYVNQSEIIKMELGCGRMQNRLVTFKDGIQACVRYRQNTDQIQGEIFSFYVGRLLNLTNLAPSVVKVVDLKDKLWKSVANEVANAQWSTNRAVVLTQYISSLESASIPEIFKPVNRHLNKIDVYKMSSKENQTVEASKEILLNKLRSKNVKKTEETPNFDHINLKLSKKVVNEFLELAQWSDLIIFDYLTANLDRIVNNLFNYQWNINIMDGPAHNLARKMDSGLLVFLDNESGLLHGYRLLKKYNVYHSLMLDNLCVFRKKTVDSLKSLYEDQSVGKKLSQMFHMKNNAVIRDILPYLPEKNVKVLHERIGKVLSQVQKCASTFR